MTDQDVDRIKEILKDIKIQVRPSVYGTTWGWRITLVPKEDD